MADLDIAALKEALALMTPGVWQLAGTRHSGNLHIGKDTRLLAIGPDGDAVAMVFFDMQTSRGHTDAVGIVLLHNSADAMIARIEALEAENARLRDPQLADYEAEAALASEGVYVWGPDGEEFERMFRVAMEARAALATKGEK